MVTRVPCMQSGSGQDSYANSSRPQNFVFNVYAKPLLSLALDHLCSSPLFLEALHIQLPESAAGTVMVPTSTKATDCLNANLDAGAVGRADAPTAAPHTQSVAHTSSPLDSLCNNRVPRLVMADFGCSHGSNTLHNAAFVLQGIQERLIKALISMNVQPLEMQYFFSDLPANNFNSIFQSLQGFLHQLRQSANASYFKIFTGAVAGSFHDALFPSNSLHFATSFYSLHWLSQVPEEVLDRESEAWNGGHIWLHGERPKVMEAYARQHQKDMRRFFQSRVQELAKGGLLFLLYPCQPPLTTFLRPHVVWYL